MAFLYFKLVAKKNCYAILSDRLRIMCMHAVHTSPAHASLFTCTVRWLLGRHSSASLCRDGQENKMAATYNVLAFKR